jgi:hypothetical protein
VRLKDSQVSGESADSERFPSVTGNGPGRDRAHAVVDSGQLD